MVSRLTRNILCLLWNFAHHTFGQVISLQNMKRWITLIGFVVSAMLAGTALAQVRIEIQVPVVVVTTNIQVSLVPNLVVIERVREPEGVLVVYRTTRASTVFYHHDRDLRARGWVRVKYQARRDGYRCEYRKGRAKARLEVRDRRSNRIEVRGKEND